MVKSLKGTINAEFFAQLRTMTVSEKARKQAEIRDAVNQRVATVESNNNFVISPSVGKFVEPLSEPKIVTKVLRFDEAFFNDVLLHLASHPDGVFIPSRRHILSQILHAKMQRGDYTPVSVRNIHASTLTWNDFEALIVSISSLKHASTTQNAASLHSFQSSMDALCRKVDAFQTASKCDNAAFVGAQFVKVTSASKSRDTSLGTSCIGLKGVASSVSAKRYRSFSSAPIWYQQGMENGPPQ